MVHEVLFVLCTLLLCQSGFREVWEFGVASSGDSSRTLVLLRVGGGGVRDGDGGNSGSPNANKTHLFVFSPPDIIIKSAL